MTDLLLFTVAALIFACIAVAAAAVDAHLASIAEYAYHDFQGYMANLASTAQACATPGKGNMPCTDGRARQSSMLLQAIAATRPDLATSDYGE
ncbi:MAG: hypothetical protein HKN06_09360 [Gammaproteobacteria bacterium]|nr:hypothetical protein [Gammaproteobacteria bacterium]